MYEIVFHVIIIMKKNAKTKGDSLYIYVLYIEEIKYFVIFMLIVVK